MYNAFWRLALFVRGQSFSVKTFDRSRNGCQVIREGAGNDFRGPSVQALPLPSRVFFSRARSCAHYFQAPATQAKHRGAYSPACFQDRLFSSSVRSAPILLSENRRSKTQSTRQKESRQRKANSASEKP